VTSKFERAFAEAADDVARTPDPDDGLGSIARRIRTRRFSLSQSCAGGMS
jgi:hypothetical protein